MRSLQNGCKATSKLNLLAILTIPDATMIIGFKNTNLMSLNKNQCRDGARNSQDSLRQNI